jgi:hypothetical protein
VDSIQAQKRDEAVSKHAPPHPDGPSRSKLPWLKKAVAATALQGPSLGAQACRLLRSSLLPQPKES